MTGKIFFSAQEGDALKMISLLGPSSAMLESAKSYVQEVKTDLASLVHHWSELMTQSCDFVYIVQLLMTHGIILCRCTQLYHRLPPGQGIRGDRRRAEMRWVSGGQVEWGD